MPRFENPAVGAAEAHTALRALAHATRSIDDPREIYSVLGSLTSAVASLSQSLHQLAAVHDGPGRRVWVAEDTSTGRAARYEVSWELHRAGAILAQVEESIGSAHSAQSRITYLHRDVPATANPPHSARENGLSL